MQGKVVVITGASRGIGAAAAWAFAQAGAQVALLARSVGAIGDLAKEIGSNALPVRCNVGDFASVHAAFAAVIARFGRVDVLINNAGVIDPIAPLAETDPEEWGRAIAVNLNGVFYGMREVLPIMRSQRSGTIITISSGAATNPIDGWSAYCTSKAAASMLTRMAHLEEAAHGIRVLGLSPGTVATDMQIKIKASGVNAVSQLNPSVHISPDWPARALVWMCSQQADPWLGRDISLRDPEIRAAVGLIG